MARVATREPLTDSRVVRPVNKAKARRNINGTYTVNPRISAPPRISALVESWNLKYKPTPPPPPPPLSLNSSQDECMNYEKAELPQISCQKYNFIKKYNWFNYGLDKGNQPEIWNKRPTRLFEDIRYVTHRNRFQQAQGAQKQQKTYCATIQMKTILSVILFIYAAQTFTSID